MVIKDIGLSCCNKRGCECVILFKGGIFRSDFVFRFILHSRLIFISLNLLPGWILEFMAFLFFLFSIFFLYLLPAHKFLFHFKEKIHFKMKTIFTIIISLLFFQLSFICTCILFQKYDFFYIEKHFFRTVSFRC